MEATAPRLKFNISEHGYMSPYQYGLTNKFIIAGRIISARSNFKIVISARSNFKKRFFQDPLYTGL
jgi:hypothetical protein